MSTREIQVLGKYDVIREIGRGSMGTVYLGHDPFNGRDVALKIAHPEDNAKDSGRGRYRKLFFNEAKVSGRLKHPNILEVYDAGIEDDIWYIVMEYIQSGRTLHSHSTPDSLLPMKDVVRQVFRCANALDYAHRRGVIHRDIKPRNILVTEDDEVNILSSLLAKRAGAQNCMTLINNSSYSSLAGCHGKYADPRVCRLSAVHVTRANSNAQRHSSNRFILLGNGLVRNADGTTSI